MRDLDDVERRLLKKLLGVAASPAFGLSRPSVIVADDLTPSETVQLPRDLVLGFATNGGSATSHVALLARSMGIPAVTGLGDVTSLVSPGDTVLLDGTAGTITISPDAAAIRDFIVAAQEAERQQIDLNAGHDLSLVNLKFFQEQIPNLKEVSIGHALICDALYLGLEETIHQYLQQLQ